MTKIIGNEEENKQQEVYNLAIREVFTDKQFNGLCIIN